MELSNGVSATSANKPSTREIHHAWRNVINWRQTDDIWQWVVGLTWRLWCWGERQEARQASYRDISMIDFQEICPTRRWVILSMGNFSLSSLLPLGFKYKNNCNSMHIKVCHDITISLYCGHYNGIAMVRYHGIAMVQYNGIAMVQYHGFCARPWLWPTCHVDISPWCQNQQHTCHTINKCWSTYRVHVIVIDATRNNQWRLLCII